MKTVLVGLDLSELDINIIKYSSFFCTSLGVNNIHFIHVAKDLELPEEVVHAYGDVFATIDDGIKHQIQDNIQKNFTADAKVEISVQEGNAVEKIIRFARIKNADLIILGRKMNLRGSGVVTNNIARKSPCSLLLVPEKNYSNDINHILVPVDLSAHSQLAVTYASKIAAKHGSRIECINVYEVPTGYYKTGKSYEQFSKIMLGHAEADFRKFNEKLNAKIEVNFLLSKDHDFADDIITFINNTNPDLVIIGSKGRTNAAVVLLGSMAEKLTRKVNNAPLMIVKQKGESMDIFDALLKL